MKNVFVRILSLILLNLAFSGHVKADLINDAVYINPNYISYYEQKVNSELNGAWTNNYINHWLPDPLNGNHNLPSFVKGITFQGVIQETDALSISTLEVKKFSQERNKYYLSSSLPGEPLKIEINVANENSSVNWLPLSIYFDPFVVGKLEQRIKLSLSYADSNLGHVVLIQDVNFEKGSYLNLKIKSPLPGVTGKVEIEIQPKGSSKPIINGLFWGEIKDESNLVVQHAETLKVSAPIWFKNQRNNPTTTIWSPGVEEETSANEIVKLSVGKPQYTTSTGYEFPLSRQSNDKYNFKVLQGLSGPSGYNGLEFYITPIRGFCSKGCSVGFYFAEEYKQNIFVYSAQEGKKSKLAATKETIGENNPAFEVFKIEPNDEVSLRVRITANDNQQKPVLRGLFIDPSLELHDINQAENEITLNLDSSENTEELDKKEEPSESISTIVSNTDVVVTVDYLPPGGHLGGGISGSYEEIKNNFPTVSNPRGETKETSGVVIEEVKEIIGEIREGTKGETEEVVEEAQETTGDIKEGSSGETEEIRGEAAEEVDIKEGTKGETEEIRGEAAEEVDIKEGTKGETEEIRGEAAEEVDIKEGTKGETEEVVGESQETTGEIKETKDLVPEPKIEIKDITAELLEETKELNNNLLNDNSTQINVSKNEPD